VRIIHVSISEEKANYDTIGGKVPELERPVVVRWGGFYMDLTNTHLFPAYETDFVVTFAASTPAKWQCGVM
jgi:hypothetical protein